VKYLSEGVCAFKLRELNFSNCLRVGTQAMNALSKRCKNIEYLSLCYCDQINKEGFEAISTLERLVSIDLTGCTCNDQVSIMYLI
jgi:hypothetical protein